jgi:UDP-N-acetylglucosamine 2-epimerase (non-hydrolysing)/GDP/UDP-N,N'-diacetylbacillosamine 2-epimerase (hydrolysing)
LKPDFGRSLKEIENDGFHVDAQIDIEMGTDDLLGTARAIGSSISNLAPVLARLQPDLMVVYADRFESFGALTASTQMRIPTAHIEGGDYTEGGALDDSVRHAMTKLAHLHFTTNEEASERIRRMGEEPWRIKTVGFPALDLIASGLYATPEEVLAKYHLDPARPVLLFTQHSVTTEFDSAAEQIRPSLAALEEATQKWNCQVILTYPNDDAGGRAIVNELNALAGKENSAIQVYPSLGRYFYHGVLNIAAACLGNSSSGIKETPALRCPCIDIGSRQQGRLRAENVLNTGYDRNEILTAIEKCLFDETFRQTVKTCSNPYGAGNAGAQICDVLASVPLDLRLIQKKMTY